MIEISRMTNLCWKKCILSAYVPIGAILDLNPISNQSISTDYLNDIIDSK